QAPGQRASAREPGHHSPARSPAAHGLPAVVLVRGRGPGCPAPARRRRAGQAALRRLLLLGAVACPCAQRRGNAHTDQYRALKLVLDALGGNGQGNENGRPELAVPALGGLFTDTEADAPLTGLELSNDALLGAVRQLAQVRDPDSKRWRSVDYRNLDA